jgi:hypothetical protein
MMKSAVNRSVALLLLWGTLDARAQASSQPVKPSPLPLSGTLPGTAQVAPELNKERATDQTFESASQAKLARGIEAAYLEKHRPPAEDVTTALDGTDKVTRIRTSLGANLCLNYRDIDRFNPGKGKRVFVLACNR